MELRKATLSCTSKQNRSLCVAMLVLTSIVGFTSCVDDSNLVSPPSNIDSIFVRFVNLADASPRILQLESGVSTGNVMYGMSSSSVRPVQDSSIVEIVNNGVVEYRSENRIRFAKSTFETLIGLRKPASAGSIVDTFLRLSQSTLLDYPSRAKIRFGNCVSDTTARFSLRIGCPSGVSVGDFVPYIGQSGFVDIFFGSTVVSLIRTANGVDELVGLFEFSTVGGQNYSILSVLEIDGSIGLRVLRDRDITESALVAANVVTEKSGYLRVVNLTSEVVDVVANGSVVAQSIAPTSTTDYLALPACNSKFADTITVSTTSGLVSVSTASIDIRDSTTIIVTSGSAGTTIQTTLLKQDKSVSLGANECSVVVLNGTDLTRQISCTLAMRTLLDTITTTGGQHIAKDLRANSVTSPSAIPAGSIPIMVHYSAQPSTMLLAVLGKFIAGVTYITVVTHNEIGFSFWAIAQSEANKTIVPVAKGCVVTVVNANYSESSTRLTIQGLFHDIIYHFRSSLVTVVPRGTTDFVLDGAPGKINGDTNQRSLILYTADSLIYTFNYAPISVAETKYARRFINAAPTVQKIRITADTAYESEEIQSPLDYGVLGDVVEVDLERRVNFSFWDAETKIRLYRLDNLSLPFGKAYTIIFTGSIAGGFTTLLQREL